jgi:aspartate carbamoyltransferase
MHLLSTKDLSKDYIEKIMATAAKMEPYALKEKQGDMMKGKILAALFYEPSTRTRLSFETAMLRLGGQVISVADAQSSSLAKGESLEDTAKIVSQYADIIAIRHPEIGSAKKMAENASVPVINAGDGAGDHPTQALLDLYTIIKERGQVDGLTVTFSGDLKNSRTANSLIYLLANYDVKFKFLSPLQLPMKDEVKKFLKDKGLSFEETSSVEEGLSGADVLYATRVQRERFKDAGEYEKLKDSFIFNRALLEKHNPKMLILHALPRVNEIATDVDDMSGAAYFRQASNGVSVRMALISLLLA